MKVPQKTELLIEAGVEMLNHLPDISKRAGPEYEHTYGRCF